MDTPLTALERELLSCVEQLVKASEISARVLCDLEKRSTKQINQRLDGLSDCVGALTQSQIESANALKAFTKGSESYADITNRLNNSLKQAKHTAQRLSEN